MFQIFNLTNNPNVQITDSLGPFTVIEHLRDTGGDAARAQESWFASKMNIRRRQLICDLSKASVVIQPGDMQWMAGETTAKTGVKGIGDLFGKAVRGKMTGESAIKPEYSGTGVVVLEPTYRHILLLDLKEWNGRVVLDDGLFLACESSVAQKISARNTLSSAAAGNEGFFNLALEGDGTAAIESPYPKEELIEVILKDDVLKVDGNFAIAWSESLRFTVERSSRTLIGSAVSEEGLVNVYRGTGKVWLAPLK